MLHKKRVFYKLSRGEEQADNLWVGVGLFLLKEKDFGFKPVKGDIGGDEHRAQVVNERLYATTDHGEDVETGVIKNQGLCTVWR